MLTASVHDYPTRVLVSSEDKIDESYLVDLCAHAYGTNDHGDVLFNGACQCAHFKFRCEPKLKNPDFMGKVFRCKHINFARDHAIDFLLPVLCKADPNLLEDHQS